jgi:streptogramin lyase
VPDPRAPTPVAYRRIPVGYVLAPLKLQAQRFSTGDAGAPIDIVWGGPETWFTGAANAIGWIGEDRKITTIPRTVGTSPTRLSTGLFWDNTRYGYHFIDPAAGRIGRVSNDGVEEGPALGLGMRPTCLGPSFSFQCEMIATDGGHLMNISRNEKFTVPERRIVAVGNGPDSRVWYLSDNELCWFHPDSGISRPVAAPEPIYADAFIRGPGIYNSLAYLDRTRNIIGWIREPNQKGYIQLEEFQLPAGLEPRALALGLGSLWFSGRGGKSLFRLDHMRTAYEYPCADNTSDLTALACGSNEIWFTEPGHSAISHARTVGL